MAECLLLENILSQEEKEYIIDLYNNNVSLRQIAEKTHHSRKSITQMLEHLNIKTTYGNHYKYNSLDENFFSVIDTDEKAYWLGFLYADGCILTPKYGEQSVKLTVAEQDCDIIEKF